MNGDAVKLKVISLCSGYGMQERGIQDSGCYEPEVVATSEIDIDAIIGYAAIHNGLTEEMVENYEYPPLDEMRDFLKEKNIGFNPEKNKVYNWDKSGKAFEKKIKKTWLACQLNHNYGDLSKIEELPEADVWFWSTPCFVKGTLVRTENGDKPIEDIEVGDDKVLTHEGRYRTVTCKMKHPTEDLIELTTSKGVVYCTGDHPFYARDCIGSFDWIPARKLTLSHSIGCFNISDSSSEEFDCTYMDFDYTYVESIRIANTISKQDVYNLSVEEDESYVLSNGLITHNCQSISIAGRLDGLNPDDNTRSSLIWQTLRLLKKAKETNTLPEYMMLENVKNLVGKRFIEDFNKLNKIIEEEFNYNVYWNVLNACECGIPQHRERVFVVYIRKDVDKGQFQFPVPFDNGLRLKDVLEKHVDDRYYVKTFKALALIKKLLGEGKIKYNDEVLTDKNVILEDDEIKVQEAEANSEGEKVVPFRRNDTDIL